MPALRRAAALLHVRYRDTQHVISVLLSPLFFLTPVFYDAAAVPERFRALYELNPMVHLIGAYRWMLLGGPTPDPAALAAVGGCSALALVVVFRAYVRASRRFAEEV